MISLQIIISPAVAVEGRAAATGLYNDPILTLASVTRSLLSYTYQRGACILNCTCDTFFLSVCLSVYRTTENRTW